MYSPSESSKRNEKGDWLKICLSLWDQFILSHSLLLQSCSLKAQISHNRALGVLKNALWIAQQKAFKRGKAGWKYPHKKISLGGKLSKADVSKQKLSDHGGRGMGELFTELQLPRGTAGLFGETYFSWRADKNTFLGRTCHGRCIGKKSPISKYTWKENVCAFKCLNKLIVLWKLYLAI